MQAVALAGLGEALCETGHRDEGIGYLHAAQAMYRQLGNEPEPARVQALLAKYTVE